MTRTTARGNRSAGWPTTLWDLIRRARDGTGDDRRVAMDLLLKLYYRPVHRFFRRVLRTGRNLTDDITQDFFTRFVEKDFLKNITVEGSFRGFLKVACRRHFITWLESTASRPLPVRGLPEKLEPLVDEEFRAWYIEEAIAATRNELSGEGKQMCLDVFEARVRFDGSKPVDYETLAGRFGRRVYDIRNLLTAARKIFRRELLRLAGERSSSPREELAELGLLQYIDLA